MKLNDPFGRLEKRHQVGYEAMRDAMLHAGIDTPQAAHEVIRKTIKRAMKFVAAGAVILVLVNLLAPQAITAALFLAFMILIWVATWTINGRRYVKRYIEEELQENKKVEHL